MSEVYLARALVAVKCYFLKDDCVADQGVSQYSIDAGGLVLLSIWDNDQRVAQGRQSASQSSGWMRLGSLEIIGKHNELAPPAAPVPLAAPAPWSVVVRHSNGQASVAWFYTVASALNDPSEYNGTIPNGEQVELVNDNSDGRHVYATVQWRAQHIVVRTVHLTNLPVQLFSHEGDPQVLYFENVTACLRSRRAGCLPNGTRATVDNANLDGNYTIASVNLPMGLRVVSTLDVHGLPQRNFQDHMVAPQPSPPAPPSPPAVPAPPAPPAVPLQNLFPLKSQVTVRHVEGQAVVGYYLQRAAALLGAVHGTVPSMSTATVLEMDAANPDAGGHCKIRITDPAKPCGSLDVYVRQAHIFSREVQEMSRKHVPYPMNARQVKIKHVDSHKKDVVFHYTAEAAQRRDPPHGKIPNDEVVSIVEQAQQASAKHVKIWYDHQDVFVNQIHVEKLVGKACMLEPTPPAQQVPAMGDIWSSLGRDDLSESYAATVATHQGTSCVMRNVAHAAASWLDHVWTESIRQRPSSVNLLVSRKCLWRIESDELQCWNARMRRLVCGLDNVPLQHQMDEREADVRAGKARWEQTRVNKGSRVPVNGNLTLVWRGCGGREEDIVAMSQGPKLWTKQDGGFFGDGHYTAYEASYAAHRAREGGEVQLNENGEKAMILFAMATAHVRVITRSGDYTSRDAFSDHYSRTLLYRKAMLATVDTYFVPVKLEPSIYKHQACRDQDADAHEVIAADDAQLLPIAVVYYREL